jgi:(p)ppGpp synthase/HD superfamily hydrolase
MSMKDWCIKKHADTNHMYDTYLPYSFHLRMVAHTAEKYKHLLDNLLDYYTGKQEFARDDNSITLRIACMRAVWGHDLIEDCRVSYNDVKHELGQEAADIIYAVSNEKGKTRKERANAAYYEGIRKTPGAVFVKLCDRIANVQYSKMTGSRMFEMYQKENSNFIQELGWFGDVTDPNYELFYDLQELFIEPRKEK